METESAIENEATSPGTPCINEQCSDVQAAYGESMTDNQQTVENKADCSKNASGGKIWTVGTLSYTTKGLLILFSWLMIGDFVWAIRDRATGPVAQVMLKKFGASDFIVGLLIGSLPGAIGLFLSPAISCWSDRCRTRWGRRIPFLIVPAPIAAVSMIGLAFSPDIGMWLHRLVGASPDTANTFVIATFGVFWTIFDFTAITANAVFGGLVNDVVPHSVIGRFYGMVRAVSLLAGIFFFYVLLGKADEYYTAIYACTGAFYGIGFTAMCFKVKEGKYPPPPSLSGEKGVHPLRAVKSYFYECFSSSYYIWYYAMTALSMMSLTAAVLFGVYAAQSFGLSLQGYGTCVAIAFAGSFILAYPLGILVDRLHPFRMSLLTLGLHGITTLCEFLFIRDAWTFSIIFVIQQILAGSYLTAVSGLPPMLLPKSRFSQMSSAGGIVMSICGILLSMLLGKFLDIMNHQYIYTFGVACIFNVLAFIAAIFLYRGFIGFGGFKSYVPPEPATIAAAETSSSKASE
ncbi:MAG TPA: MFS transporter [Phycisphaerae bacterium]|nr:MFS transporter [Phycisphaerae bacterium]